MSTFSNNVFVSDPITGTDANVTAGGALRIDGSAVTQPVSVAGTVPVSGTITVVQPTGSNLNVDVANVIQTSTALASSSTVTQITSTAANQVLLASNANRKSAVLFFSSGNWNVKYGVGATATSFTYNISSANTSVTVSGWSGEIDAICTTSNKLVNVTELS